MEIKKVVWASILGALSIVIDILFKLIVPLQTMGTPFYAIPIVVAAIFLGPKYSISIAFLGDLISTTLAGDTFFPLYSLGSTFWGIIPGFFLKDKYKFSYILLILLGTHVLVSLTNSFATYVHFSQAAMLADLPLRAALIIPNTIIISLLVEALLEPIKLRRASN